MQKTTFKIAQMDCPSEEQMIRLKLADESNIEAMSFDIDQRQLIVYHTGAYGDIFDKLDSLKLGTSIVDSIPAEAVVDDNQAQQRRLLWQVLGINFSLFLFEIVTGFVSKSMGLVADSLDMLADSLVYGLALFAVGSTVAHQKSVAKMSGYFQLFLALLGVAEVARRFVGVESMPHFQTMIIISAIALLGNATCLYLLKKSKSQEAHIQASMIFTSNDVIVNIGVIVAGILVYMTKSNYPDLVVGTIVFGLVANGAIKILNLSK